MSKKRRSTGPTANPEPQPAPQPAPAAGEPTASPALDDESQALATTPEALEAALRADLAAQITDIETPEPDEDEPDPELLPGEEEEEEEEAPESAPTEPGEIEEEEPAAQGPWPKSYFKRIRKLNDRIAQLEERLAEAQPEPAAPAASPSVPGAISADESKIQGEIDTRKSWVRDLAGYIRKLEEGETPATPDGKPITRTAEELETMREQFLEEIQDLKADLRDNRRERAHQARALESDLAARHPWMSDSTNRDTRTVTAILQRYPVLSAIPEARTWLADGLAYQRLLQRARQAQNGQRPAPAGARPPARPSAAPRRPPTGAAASQRNMEEFLKTGDRAAGKHLIESLI